MQVARDGFPAQFQPPLPSNLKKASKPNKEGYDENLSKFIRFIDRDYFAPYLESELLSFIDYFAFKKGLSDIRVVYNGTSCGITLSIWVPNFWLPNAISITRILGFNYESVDIDLGEMFLNFPLIQFLHRYSGVDLTPMLDDL